MSMSYLRLTENHSLNAKILAKIQQVVHQEACSQLENFFLAEASELIALSIAIDKLCLEEMEKTEKKD